MMLGGTIPLMTACLNYLIKGTLLKLHEKIGILIIMIGNILLYVYAILNEEKFDNSNPIFGIIFSLLSHLFFSFLMIGEEHILTKYKIYYNLLAGLEGFFALI